MPELVPFTQDEMDEIAGFIGDISQRHGLWVQTCGTREDYSRFGIHKSGCMTLKILGNANGVEFRDLKKGDEVVAGNQVSYLKRQDQDATLDLFLS